MGTHKTMSKNYRKIFERYHQCTLLEDIDIHHIDSNHDNNHPDNLRAVTLQEHYDIHKLQNDHYACYMIATRMKTPPGDWREMARINGRKSGIKNRDNEVGLTVWAKNNPALAKEQRSKAGKVGGKIATDLQLGFHNLSDERKKEIASQGGKKAAELGLGFKAGHAATAGKIGGKKGGAYAKENRTGIFALTPEQIKAKNQKAAITKLINNGKASAWPKKEVI